MTYCLNNFLYCYLYQTRVTIHTLNSDKLANRISLLSQFVCLLQGVIFSLSGGDILRFIRASL